MKKEIVVFARVGMFYANAGRTEKPFGFATASDGQEFFLRMSDCRKIVPGVSEPDFSLERWGQWPMRGSEVVILPDHHIPRFGQKPRAFCWGYWSFWNNALTEIARRPVYVVMGENRFRGQIMNSSVRTQEVVRGTREELQMYPRGNENDPLGTSKPYRSGPCQRINRWFLQKDGGLIPCDDPRSLQSSVMLSGLGSEAGSHPNGESVRGVSLRGELETLA